MNEKQTRQAFAAEAEFERKLDAAEAALRKAQDEAREAREKASEEAETLRRKVKAAKKKTEREREQVEEKDAELARFTQKLQDVMNLLDASREECESLRASTSESDSGATQATAQLEAEVATLAGQVAELKGTLRARALRRRREARRARPRGGDQSRQSHHRRG